MKNLDALTQEFNTKYERFFIGCDAVEDSGLWDIEEYGDMEAFYQNDLVSVIIRLIAADGSISSKEVEYLNKSFGFEYTVEELNEVYRSCKDDIGSYFDEQFQNGISVMRSKNEKLADAYKELLGLICDIIASSDGIVSPEEADEIRNLKSMFT
ncbi:MAG: TerB family tellurite resistance protein [Ruminococcus sp.]|nr:TerB family tellurite resistance protein [Ruminococcus sp.]